jgi:hypothetical protein
MPATTTGHPAGNQTKQNAAPVSLVPFTRSAREHEEVFVDISQQIGAGSVSLPQQDVAASGYVRGIDLLVEATGGVGGAATVAAAEDAPFSALAEIVLRDVNAAPIVGPLSGYDLYLINKWGGYDANQTDPKQRPSYSAVATGAGASGNFSFSLRIPVEINRRDGLGSLANMNAASTYKLAMTLAPSAQIYTTAPATTLPTVRLRATLEAWTQPTPADLRGNPQAQTPPAHGTTAYWSKTTLAIASGSQQPRLPRVGNYLRNVIFVMRDGAGSRNVGDGYFPDPGSIYWDTRLLTQRLRTKWKDTMVRRTDTTATVETARGLDRGVYVYDFAHDFDGLIGNELRDGWLPTTQSTRLELQGTVTGAGNLTVLTNDVAPQGEIFV